MAGSENIVGSETSSKSVTGTVNGSHEFMIKGYSLAKGIGVGKYITSERFSVGGHEWAIYFYPDGFRPEDKSLFVSLFITLVSKSINVRAICEITLLDQSGNGNHKVNTRFNRSLANGPHTFKQDSKWGYNRYFRRTGLEKSCFLKDDCLVINCTVGVVVPSILYPNTIKVPESDIGAHLGTLLDNKDTSDVTFLVGEERFHAHKIILAARSPIFQTEFFDGMQKDNRDIIVTDIEPKVFKALLHFIYKDTLIEDEELYMSYSASSVSESFPAKLLAAADQYCLPKLKLICQSILSENISTDSVGYILALAHRYHAIELKSICLQFCCKNLDQNHSSEGGS